MPSCETVSSPIRSHTCYVCIGDPMRMHDEVAKILKAYREVWSALLAVSISPSNGQVAASSSR